MIEVTFQKFGLLVVDTAGDIDSGSPIFHSKVTMVEFRMLNGLLPEQN